MKHDLFARMKGWFDLFAKRPDVKFVGETPLRLEDPVEPKSPLPPELAAFAKQTACFSFAYKLVPRPNPNIGDPDGYLFLSLSGYKGKVHLPIEGRGTFDKAVDLDLDEYGTGIAGFAVTDTPEPFIAWSVEDTICYPSLDAYLQAGARLAFFQVFDTGSSWQRNAGADHPLHDRSVPRSTPLPELRAALVKRGATPDLADDLVAWLGADVALLLPLGS